MRSYLKLSDKNLMDVAMKTMHKPAIRTGIELLIKTLIDDTTEDLAASVSERLRDAVTMATINVRVRLNTVNTTTAESKAGTGAQIDDSFKYSAVAVSATIMEGSVMYDVDDVNEAKTHAERVAVTDIVVKDGIAVRLRMSLSLARYSLRDMWYTEFCKFFVNVGAQPNAVRLNFFPPQKIRQKIHCIG